MLPLNGPTDLPDLCNFKQGGNVLPLSRLYFLFPTFSIFSSDLFHAQIFRFYPPPPNSFFFFPFVRIMGKLIERWDYLSGFDDYLAAFTLRTWIPMILGSSLRENYDIVRGFSTRGTFSFTNFSNCLDNFVETTKVKLVQSVFKISRKELGKRLATLIIKL